MKTVRRILILSTGTETPGDLSAMVESLAAQDAAVVVRRCEDDYDALLDDIAQADTVVCWK